MVLEKCGDAAGAAVAKIETYGFGGQAGVDASFDQPSVNQIV